MNPAQLKSFLPSSSVRTKPKSNAKSKDSKIVLPAPQYNEMMRTRERLQNGEKLSRPELRRFLQIMRKKDPKMGMRDIQIYILQVQEIHKANLEAERQQSLSESSPMTPGANSSATSETPKPNKKQTVKSKSTKTKEEPKSPPLPRKTRPGGSVKSASEKSTEPPT